MKGQKQDAALEKSVKMDVLFVNCIQESMQRL